MPSAPSPCQVHICWVWRVWRGMVDRPKWWQGLESLELQGLLASLSTIYSALKNVILETHSGNDSILFTAVRFNLIVEVKLTQISSCVYSAQHHDTCLPTVNSVYCFLMLFSAGLLMLLHWSPFRLDLFGNVESVAHNHHVRSSYMNATAAVVQEAYRAYFTFVKTLYQPENLLTYKMKSGDIITFNNQRVLHGRAAFTATSSRWLEGCYFDWDEMFSSIRVLRNRLGIESRAWQHPKI